ncbi:hypothetical protein RDWZM_002205 [Blomia tropicalis]|uniref:OPA3-like protein n=1 Tax=Blomia tropicalis TaxID=40697 RepID=A0A9Q0RRH5_BLOTA|nr:Optic atrophy 3 protein [Blomia tropicalis]KAJ6223660.1 hypothetical protein RDWZM_002205 [Blomia tropicalis]
MAVGAFPLVKLGALAIRQIAKPIANMLKTRAKANPFFRNYICMPPAQMYHYFDVNVRMKLLGLGKPSNVKKLNEAAAIDLGAELLGESIIFLVAVITLAAEYTRQSKKSAAEAAEVEARWSETEKRIEELEFFSEKQRVEIRELTRLVYSKNPNAPPPPPPSTPIIPTNTVKSQKQTSQQPPLNSAINESLDKLNIQKKE